MSHFPLPWDGTCRKVCRPKRSEKRPVTPKACARFVKACLNDGFTEEAICKELKAVISCCCTEEDRIQIGLAKGAALEAQKKLESRWAGSLESLLGLAGFVGPAPVAAEEAIAVAAGVSVSWWAIIVAGIGLLVASLRDAWITQSAVAQQQYAIRTLVDVQQRICESTVGE